ncbi:MAG: hypothetical protein ABUS79_01640 [Pseudomonadota bacterium]
MSEASSRTSEATVEHGAGGQQGQQGPERKTGGSVRSATSVRLVARRLGLKLAPVVLDLGAGQPRFGSYLEWDEAANRALLSPVAGGALRVALEAGGESFRIRSSDPREPWMLTARHIHLLDENTAVVDLTNGQATRLPDRIPGRTRATGCEPLVLAVHAGPAAIEGHVFPVTDLGASHCLVDATLPLEPGDGLGLVDIIGERRIVRRASARVIEVIPWVTALGDRRFRCRLMLEPPTSSAALEDAYDLLSDADRIGRLFELAGMVDLAGWYDAPGWPRAAMHITEVGNRLVRLNVDALPPPDAIPLPDEVRIGFELFSASYECRVRLHRRRGGKLDVALPFVMRRSRRRREQRAQVPEAMGMKVVFRNTATGELARRPVKDLSFGGLCFEVDPLSDVLWKGACLENAKLLSNQGAVSLGDLEVCAVERSAGGTLLCHVANRGAAPSEKAVLVNLLATLHHPAAERHDGVDFSMMVNLYERSGLLGEFMLRNLRPVLPAAAITWRKLHALGTVAACTLTSRRPPSVAPQAAVTAVGVWDRTWLAQHFGATPTADRSAAGTLQLAYMDFVLPRPDAHYLAFFVKADNGSMNAFYERFFELTGTPESVSRIAVSVWSRSGGANAAAVAAFDRPAGLTVRPLHTQDELLLSRAAERSLGPMVARALSFVPKGFGLADTSRLFARLRLERRRHTTLIGRGDEPVAALLKERISPGVNLTWMLDAWWLLPVSPRSDDFPAALSLAADEIVRAPDDRPGGDKLLILPDGTPTDRFEAAGFRRLLSAHLYVLNRSGLRRYHEYISGRYGELDAKLARHETRALRRAS